MGKAIILRQDIYPYVASGICLEGRRLVLTQKYTPEKYPKYENYDAIDVEKLADIPCDYNGIMGVPVSLLNHSCPVQMHVFALALVQDKADRGRKPGRISARLLARCYTGADTIYFMPDTE